MALHPGQTKPGARSALSNRNSIDRPKASAARGEEVTMGDDRMSAKRWRAVVCIARCRRTAPDAHRSPCTVPASELLQRGEQVLSTARTKGNFAYKGVM